MDRTITLAVAVLWASCAVATDGGAAKEQRPRAEDRRKPMGVLFVGLVKDSEKDLPKRFDELKS